VIFAKTLAHRKPNTAAGYYAGIVTGCYLSIGPAKMSAHILR